MYVLYHFPQSQHARRVVSLLEEAGLQVGEVTERPDPNFAAGIVVEQNPASGVRVGADTPVNLVVSTGPETVLVPEVEGLSERANSTARES